jgi:hypothetical protein
MIDHSKSAIWFASIWPSSEQACKRRRSLFTDNITQPLSLRELHGHNGNVIIL